MTTCRVNLEGKMTLERKEIMGDIGTHYSPELVEYYLKGYESLLMDTFCMACRENNSCQVYDTYLKGVRK